MTIIAKGVVTFPTDLMAKAEGPVILIPVKNMNIASMADITAGVRNVLGFKEIFSPENKATPYVN